MNQPVPKLRRRRRGAEDSTEYAPAAMESDPADETTDELGPAQTDRRDPSPLLAAEALEPPCEPSVGSGDPDGGGGGGRGRRSGGRDRGGLIGAASNFSIQYNLGVIAPALVLLDPSRSSENIPQSDAVYPRSDEVDSILKSAVFFGAVLGQCSMGLLGDVAGLGNAMILTNLIALLGTVGCTISPLLGRNRTDEVYVFLAISRAVLGVGVGGKYPLASAMRAESAETSEESDDSHGDHRAKEVASSFFWQTPGSIFPYVVSLILLLIFGDETAGIGKDHSAATLTQYAILVGIGAIPSLIVLVFTWQQLLIHPPETMQQGMINDAVGDGENGGRRWYLFCRCKQGYRRIGRQSSLSVAFHNRTYWRTLVGTGLSWGLYDFVYYGTAFNLPEILTRVLGEESGLIASSWREALVAAMGIPGVVCAIWMIEPMGGPKPLQGWGFVLIGLSCVLLSLFYNGGNDTGPISKWGAFVACCLLIFALNWGCNVSTYVMPIEKFPKDCRSSFHGLSAGMGKVGALVGSAIFTELNAKSVSLTFIACVISCFGGVWVTHSFIPPVKKETFFVHSNDRHDGFHEQAQVLEEGTHCVNPLQMEGNN